MVLIKKKANKDLKSLDQFVDEQYGEKGTIKRDEFEKGYDTFKLGYLIKQTRLEERICQHNNKL